MHPQDLQEVKSDVKQIRSDIATIKETQVEHTGILREHIKRTELNEARIHKLEQWLLGLLTSILVGLVIKLILKA